MNKEELYLDKIDRLEDEARSLQIRALGLKHAVLSGRGWGISKELIGLSYTYFYRKGKTLHICEDEAIADHDNPTT